MLIILVMLCPVVLGQAVPKDTDSATLQTIQQEHKNTRKFVSDELTRQRNEFYTEMESRSKYYENRAENLINTAVWKLSLLWGGVVLIVFGLSSFLNRKLEQRKWSKMLDSVKHQIISEVNAKKTEAESEIAHKAQAVAQQHQQARQQYRQTQDARTELVELQKKIEAQTAQVRQMISKVI